MAEQKLQAIIDVKDEGSDKMKKFGEESEKAFEKAKESSEQFSKALATVSKGLVVFGGAITGAMGYAVSKAADAQAQMASMDATLATMGKTGLEARDAILAAADATIQLGFDNEDAAISISKLFQRTGDLTEATNLNNLAMDLARAKHISLEDASNAVGMALSGNTKVLKAFGVEVSDTATPMEALAALQGKVAGQAEKFADTFAGRMEILKIKTDELWEKVGDQLLPKLTELAEWVGKVADKILIWTNEHPALTEGLVMVAAAVGALALVAGTLGLVLPVLTTGVTALGTAFMILAANPIVLVIAGIALLGVAIYELITNWEWCKQRTLEIWDSLAPETREKIRTLAKVLTLGLSEIVIFVVSHWEEIKKVWNVAMAAIKVQWEAVWTDIKNFLPSIWAGIQSIVGTGVDFVMSKINALIALYERAKAIVSVPINFISNAISTPLGSGGTGSAGQSLGKRAMGGRVSGGSSYLVGEVGAEIFRPDTPGTVIPSSRSGGSGGSTVNITITGNTLLDEDAGEKIGDMIMKRLGMNTRLAF